MPCHRGGERYVVELAALPDDVPPHVRLKHFLESALRAWRLRCRSIRETPPQTPPVATHQGSGRRRRGRGGPPPSDAAAPS
jgi:hypothetical protein